VGFSHPIRWRSYNMVIVVLWGAPGHAHHGELPNRIPEAAFYKQSHALRRLPITRSTAPVGPPVGGQPQPPKPDGGAAHVNAYSAPMRWSGSQGKREGDPRTPIRAVGL